MMARLPLLLMLLVAAVSGQTFINYSGVPSSLVRLLEGGGHAAGSIRRSGAVGYTDPCNPTPCGRNTRCSIDNSGRALCRCLPGYFPKPDTLTGCDVQCHRNSECGQGYECLGNKCQQRQTSIRGRAIGPIYTGAASNPGYRTRNDFGRVAPPAPPTDPCAAGVCGANADCRNVNSRAVCSCPAGYQGDPLTGCRRGECYEDSGCSFNKACIDLRCQDPCTTGVCGSGATCQVENHGAICSCPTNYIGDPFVSCRYDPGAATCKKRRGGATVVSPPAPPAAPSAVRRHTGHTAACTPSPCGENTNCKAQNGQAICSCISNYIGSPLSGCRPECVSSSECAGHQACVQNKCRNACTDACGQGAKCEAVNHRAVCSCPQYYRGSGLTGCYPECTSHAECGLHQSCYQLRCADPCVGACGSGAECTVTNHKAICKCPRGFEGHPFDRCTRAQPKNLCVPNPCGASAQCTPGTDNTGKPRPVCTCPRGYFGNALVSCQRGECETSSDCPRSQACYSYSCRNPCLSDAGGNVCGTNGLCNAKNHKAVCYCPREYTGDPLTECRLKPIARANTGRRFKRFLDGLLTFGRAQEVQDQEQVEAEEEAGVQ